MFSMKRAYTWLALTALFGSACASGAGGPSTRSENPVLAMPSPSGLISRYLAFRPHVMQTRPDVLVCIREFSEDDAARTVEAGSASSVRVDTTCLGSRNSISAGGAPLLIIEGVAMGSDTSRVFATYNQGKSPRKWHEEFVWFRPPIPGDWRLIVGPIAPPH